MSKFANLCGAIIDPNAKRSFRQSLSRKVYSDLPRESGKGKQRLLWKYQRDVFGKDFSEIQTIGDCVGKAIQRAVMMLWCVRISLLQKKETLPGIPASEVPYALGRHEIGKDKIKGDGCVVSWALKGTMEFGLLLRKKYPGLDLSVYSGDRARELGRYGLPDLLEPIARLSPVRAAAPLRATSELRDSLYNGEVPFGGSNSIPVDGAVRDRNGFINLGDRGGHSTIFTGFDDTSGGLIFYYDNASWNEVDGPRPFDCPVHGGWVTERKAAQMLSEGEWYALSDAWTMPNQAEELFDIF